MATDRAENPMQNAAGWQVKALQALLTLMGLRTLAQVFWVEQGPGGRKEFVNPADLDDERVAQFALVVDKRGVLQFQQLNPAPYAQPIGAEIERQAAENVFAYTETFNVGLLWVMLSRPGVDPLNAARSIFDMLFPGSSEEEFWRYLLRDAVIRSGAEKIVRKKIEAVVKR